jgi:guanylate kinase
MSSERGNLVIVSAASGSGKSTLVDLAMEYLRGMGVTPAERCITCTTRTPRGLERDGVDYQFLSEEEFDRRIAAGDFLEYARVHGGRLYGTSRSAVEAVLTRGVDLFLVIDVQGAASVRARMPEAVSVFILPPSFDALEARLRARGVAENHSDEKDLAIRLASARHEVLRYTEFDYVIVNDDRDRAAAALASIVVAERSRERLQRKRIDEILKTFESEGGSLHARNL